MDHEQALKRGIQRMGITRAELEGEILELLNRDTTYTGYFTPAKVQGAIKDCLDYVAVHMMMAGEGWLQQVVFLDTTAGTNSTELPPQIGMIHKIAYLNGTDYMPLRFDDGAFDADLSADSGEAFPVSYKLMSNKITFPSLLSEGGTRYLRIECSMYPRVLLADGDMVDPQFDNTARNYIKWRAASQLITQVGKRVSDWKEYEREWYDALEKILNNRSRVPQFVRDFQ
jgi:hypothetical protein